LIGCESRDDILVEVVTRTNAQRVYSTKYNEARKLTMVPISQRDGSDHDGHDAWRLAWRMMHLQYGPVNSQGGPSSMPHMVERVLEIELT
jgi:hypothetical protein